MNRTSRHSENSAHASRSGRVLPFLVSLAWIGFVALAATWGLGGRKLFEKSLTALATPVGLAWLSLFGIGWWLFRTDRRGEATVVFLTWLVLTLGGNIWVTHQLVGHLEAPWQEVDGITGEPFDVVVVLGGGTSERGPGRAQLTADGERVTTAARMFQAGKTQRIICTGTQRWRATENDLHFREEAIQILVGLGIPADRIEPLEGHNTSKEMQSLRSWIEQQPDPAIRIGVITSAYHLSRAMRLAAANGIVAEGIPANFRTPQLAVSHSWVIPTAENLRNSAIAIKEYLASFVGR